jgi:hypothetical protein
VKRFRTVPYIAEIDTPSTVENQTVACRIPMPVSPSALVAPAILEET